MKPKIKKFNTAELIKENRKLKKENKKLNKFISEVKTSVEELRKEFKCYLYDSSGSI
jgi:hypothetical protein